ncbi:hypothetical protein [Endozoicomonas sp. SESOKO1]|uniref:hypothetical protein n=1 Tax=Endozoicomonas sp. SESOKO1 TaxID=2828742 RepID=UPI0021480414|nr:hypothetical protein [Endozoicomonas sp. SESOKO1]
MNKSGCKPDSWLPPTTPPSMRLSACVPSGSTEEFVQKLKETSCTASHREYVKWQDGFFRKYDGLPVKPMDALD